MTIAALLSAACGALLGLGADPELENVPSPTPESGAPREDAGPAIEGGEDSGAEGSSVLCQTAPCAPQTLAQLTGGLPFALARTADGIVVAHQAPIGGRIVALTITPAGDAGAPIDLDPTCVSVADCPGVSTMI